MAYATRVLLLVVLAILLVGGLWWWLSDGVGSDIVVDNNPDVVLDDNDNLPPSYPTGWLIAQGSAADFYYPPTLVVGATTTYAQAVDWPPSLTTGTTTYECVEAGTETERAGGTEEVRVSGTNYCRTISAEGAAGSTYRQYAYVWAHDNGTATLTFSARFPNCANYDGAEVDACEATQASFSPDSLAHSIAETIEWNQI